MVAPVIMKFGTDDQKKKFLPDILNTNVWWCQGYSEPGAGSDLASLRTRAEDKGDHYLVNGVKTWTTMAQYADWMFCLVRTSQEEKRQMGISFLLIDMHSPGVTVTPIITLDQPGDGFQEINMVYLEDVKVPKSNLVGEEGRGWTCAKYLLEFERGNAYSPALKGVLTQLRAVATSEHDGSGGCLLDDATLRARFDDVEIQILALEFTELRILGALAAGQNVGPESSLLKTRGTEIQQAATELALEVSGYYANPFDGSVPSRGDNFSPVGPEHANGVAQDYFNTRKVSIFAGSNEIQRNIMAKLVLGLG
jgi:alkylation response protein AidB-like acyl-CoA dehydrogenase